MEGGSRGEKCALRVDGWWRALCSAHGGLGGVLVRAGLSPCVGGGYNDISLWVVVSSRPDVSSSGAAVMAMRWQLSPRLPMMNNNRSADDPGYAERRKRCNDGNVGHSTIDGRKIR